VLFRSEAHYYFETKPFDDHPRNMSTISNLQSGEDDGTQSPRSAHSQDSSETQSDKMSSRSIHSPSNQSFGIATSNADEGGLAMDQHRVKRRKYELLSHVEPPVPAVSSEQKGLMASAPASEMTALDCAQVIHSLRHNNTGCNALQLHPQAPTPQAILRSITLPPITSISSLNASPMLKMCPMPFLSPLSSSFHHHPSPSPMRFSDPMSRMAMDMLSRSIPHAQNKRPYP